MQIFKNTTMQKGLESFLPQATDEEQKVVLNKVGSLLRTDQTIKNPEIFYTHLERITLKNSKSIDSNNIVLTEEILSGLQSRIKQYRISLNPDPKKVSKHRNREYGIMLRLLEKYK